MNFPFSRFLFILHNIFQKTLIPYFHDWKSYRNFYGLPGAVGTLDVSSVMYVDHGTVAFQHIFKGCRTQ